MAGRLFIEFCGEEWVLGPGEALTVGRAADVVVDENPYLHRVLGRFVEQGGCWFFRNEGARTVVTVLERDGAGSASVGPGSAAALVHAELALVFAAGPATYELAVVVEDAELSADLGAPPRGVPVTLEWGRVDLNPDQRALLAVLCEPRLRNPADRSVPLPSNREGAERLGWTVPRFNRKLDHLCAKLARAGVRGVHGDAGLVAADRRRVAVEHAIQVGLVTLSDLPAPAATG